MSRQCSVEGCPKNYYARGLCEMHLQRLRKYGSTDDRETTHASPEVRFWRKVQKAGGDECWLWAGKTEANGYGRFQIGGRGSPQIGAHRVSFEMANGFKPEVVMHKCDNPGCVNPSHLSAGTYKENTADMFAKGRNRAGGARKGAENHNVKLTADDVRAIRLRGDESAASVGRDYGVDHGTIRAIRRGITWKHVT